MTWILIFIAVTGLLMGFQWFAKSVYWISSGGKQMVQFEESYSDSTLAKSAIGKKPAMDINYDIHIGAIAGLPGKIIAFLASLIAASLPITGFIIWRGKKKNGKKI